MELKENQSTQTITFSNVFEELDRKKILEKGLENQEDTPTFERQMTFTNNAFVSNQNNPNKDLEEEIKKLKEENLKLEQTISTQAISFKKELHSKDLIISKKNEIIQEQKIQLTENLPTPIGGEEEDFYEETFSEKIQSKLDTFIHKFFKKNEDEEDIDNVLSKKNKLHFSNKSSIPILILFSNPQSSKNYSNDFYMPEESFKQEIDL